MVFLGDDDPKTVDDTSGNIEKDDNGGLTAGGAVDDDVCDSWECDDECIPVVTGEDLLSSDPNIGCSKPFASSAYAVVTFF